jgi:hypothetical protein
LLLLLPGPPGNDYIPLQDFVFRKPQGFSDKSGWRSGYIRVGVFKNAGNLSHSARTILGLNLGNKFSVQLRSMTSRLISECPGYVYAIDY